MKLIHIDDIYDFVGALEFMRRFCPEILINSVKKFAICGLNLLHNYNQIKIADIFLYDTLLSLLDILN